MTSKLVIPPPVSNVIVLYLRYIPIIGGIAAGLLISALLIGAGVLG